ncbi:MAG: hypothetical protein DI596_09060, partial [Azospira oryzae]
AILGAGLAGLAAAAEGGFRFFGYLILHTPEYFRRDSSALPHVLAGGVEAGRLGQAGTGSS